MEHRKLGSTGPHTSQLGLGLMGMSDLYGPADRAESLATIAAALDAGITLLDTGDFYGMGHNEMLLGEALRSVPREQVQVSVKFGAVRDVDGGFIGYDARPQSVANFAAYSLRRLGTDYIDIYRPSRVDPATPIEDTVGAMAELVRKGHVRHIGLSEVNAETLRRAHAVHPIVDVQIEYSMISRGIESGLLQAARELGVGITAYGVLSRGLISGHWTAQRAGEGDFRGQYSPRFQGENLTHNLDLVERMREVAQAKGISMAQLAIAWVIAQGRAQGATIVPLVGARTRQRLQEALGALDATLLQSDLAALDLIVPHGAAAGGRYNDYQLSHLDSEKAA